jgi:hypothetical protein
MLIAGYGTLRSLKAVIAQTPGEVPLLIRDLVYFG